MKTIKCKCGKDIILDDIDFDRTAIVKISCHPRSGPFITDHDMNGKTVTRSLASCILGDPRMFDHVDRNNHNMLRDNLRPATYSQNNANKKGYSSSGYKYVYQMKDASRNKPFRAEVRKDGVAHHGGTFRTPEEAARAGDILAIELHGEFAYTNFPKENYKQPNT